MDFRRAKTVTYILFAVGVALCLLYALFYSIGIHAPAVIMLLLALGSFTAGVIISVKYYRCPYCDSMLPGRYSTPDYCPRCGKEL